MSLVPVSDWQRFRRARRNGRIDGRKAIPAPGESTCPKYLELISADGKRRIDHLEWGFQRLDSRLNLQYRDRAVLYGQKIEALTLALAEVETARQAYAERPTERRKMVWQQSLIALARARREAERAERKLERSIARRIAVYRQFCSACLCENQVTEGCMREYAVANLREREEHVPGLMEEARPRLSLPDMSGLHWEPALDVARAGKARGVEPASLRTLPAAGKPSVSL